MAWCRGEIFSHDLTHPKWLDVRERNPRLDGCVRVQVCFFCGGGVVEICWEKDVGAGEFEGISLSHCLFGWVVSQFSCVDVFLF